MIETNFTPFPYLTSLRLRLRRLEQQDQQEIFNLRSDERVNLHLDRQPAKSLEDARLFIEKINNVVEKNEGVYWAICLKENPKLIGTVCYFDFSSAEESAEIGYELHPFYQGKGIMQEAVSLVIQFGFEVIQLKKITAFPSVDNLQSIKLLERNGFELNEDRSESKGSLIKYVLLRNSLPLSRNMRDRFLLCFPMLLCSYVFKWNDGYRFLDCFQIRR